MNYHHIYHAGNFADIFKHIILCLCLEKLHEKSTAFFALDTHAGIAKYDLENEKSLKTAEAQNGIKKILQQQNFRQILPERYLKILAKLNRCEITELANKIKFYSGSPIIIKDYLRADDKAIFAELNREDFIQLKRSFAGNKKFAILNEDGFHLLKSKLPPLEKRGLVIIDPAFEKDQSVVSNDYEKIIEGLKEANKRFAHAIYLLWYPIINKELEQNNLADFYQKIKALNFDKKMHITFNLGKNAENQEKMTACGMFIFNAPWQLDEKLKIILPQILEILKEGENSNFEISNL